MKVKIQAIALFYNRGVGFPDQLPPVCCKWLRAPITCLLLTTTLFPPLVSRIPPIAFLLQSFYTPCLPTPTPVSRFTTMAPCFWFWPYSHFLDLPLFTTGPKVFFVYIIIDFSLNNLSKVYYNTIFNQVYSFTHFGPYSHNGWDQDPQSQTLSAFCN